ncbi:LuxR C-terminal-related transcriptional regulator [Mycolicibacterium sp. BiH015]|uniref:ATP-binding protein n=1 Tax=Mycolicibacterium sp. BiH015 TaxID=3018808 RepID=UPI0022DFD368|nr:LuxR C-terminal-related transcriptional regulator [Mycolicibacterium sp. BiH015]MDA2893260.1 LuxR C-terminal-related transcriptional regulator [Mycolicibacterium sp. BiH015]
MRHTTRGDGHLPADVTGFIGRRRELNEVRGLLGASRLVTLTGVGGVGKTRMALKVAADARRAFADGAWFVELAALQDATLLADTVADALGVVKHASKAPLAQLLDHLVDKHLLLVLDNCEHLSGDCAALVSELLREAPDLRVVVTSRQSLGVLGEHIFTVPPMSTPSAGERLDVSTLAGYDAVALLCARASEGSSGFHITDENGPLVARLCERLDGIPLAIELAAARLRTLTVKDVLDRLDHRFRLLTNGNCAAMPRHQTLQALIDWSYELCSPAEQALWARLSVFAGSFSLEAVESVCSATDPGGAATVDVIDALVRKSILIADPAGEQTRYRLLETVREYGAGRLSATDERAPLQAAHRRYFQRLAERSHAEWCGPQQAVWLARLRRDHANLRAALDRCIDDKADDQACAMAAALQWFWIAGGSLGEGRRWLAQALTLAAGQQPRPAHAKAMWVDAYLALLRGETSAARDRLEEASQTAECTDATDLRGYLAQLCGMAALFDGALPEARRHYEESLSTHERHGDTTAVVSMLFQLAVVCLFTGDHDLAAAHCERSLRLSARFGERWAASYALWVLSINRWTVGDYVGATDLARESLRVKLDFGDDLGIAHMVELLAWIAASDQRYTDSGHLLGVADSIWRKLGTSMTSFGTHLADCHAAAQAQVRDAVGAAAAEVLIAEGAAMGASGIAAALDGDDTQPPEPATQSALSTREYEVASLIARGMTNRQIAAELVLSSRTIDSHVQHILTKLGFSSRSQIAGWHASQ